MVAAPNDNAPVLLAERFPPIVSEARVSAPTSVIVTALVPEFERVTAPVNALLAPLAVKLMVLLPAVNDEVPVIANVPVGEIAPPLLVTESRPATVLAPNDNAPVLVV